jgi:hypothetical protein
MPKAPDPVALILCDGVHVDPTAAKMSLVGLFTSLRFPSFPTPARRFTAYAALYGGEGEGRMRLEVKRADTEALIYWKEVWRGFAAPDMMSTAEVKARKCAFPSPGRYIVNLLFEGEIICYSVLDVFRG